MKRSAVLVLPFLLASLVLFPPGAAAAVEELKVLEDTITWPGWEGAAAFDNNDRGDIVGLSLIAGSQRGFLCTGNSCMDIIPPGWTDSRAIAISENGLIIGEGNGGPAMGFLYNAGTYTPLPIPGMTNIQYDGVNDSGQVVGTGYTGAAYEGFLYEGGASTNILPAALGFTSVNGIYINNSGQIAGNGSTAGGSAAFYINGAPSLVGPAGWTDVSVIGINDRGDIAGNGNGGTGTSCFLRRDGVYETISHPDWLAAQCMALNNNGDIFGYGVKGPMTFIQFIYRDGTFYEIDIERGYFLPSAVNSRYEIVGYSPTPTGVSSFRLSILPSPDLTAGGKDGPVGAGPAGSSRLKLSMLAWTFKKLGVEWWLVASTPAGIYSYDPLAGSWSAGLTPAVHMPLRDIRSSRFPAAPAGGPGIYTYYFGVDPFTNGRIDPAVWFADILTVIRR